MKRGDVSQSSFGFTIRESIPSADNDGKVTSTVTDVARLYDVSPVTFPAYSMTEATARSLNEFKAENEKPTEEPETEFEKREEENPEQEERKESVTDNLEYYKLRLAEIEE